MTTRLPIPAASIITPMILLALTRRPSRLSQTSLLNWAATWVSLAEARACSPSLLTISTSACGTSSQFRRGRTRIFGVQFAHPFAPAADRLERGALQRLVTVCEDANQHRQIQAGDSLDMPWNDGARCDVGRRPAEHVGQDQNAGPG